MQKKIFHKHWLIYLFFIQSIFEINAQTVGHCGTALIENSNKNWQQDEKKIKEFLNNKKNRNLDSLITIPVVFHIVWKDPIENIPDSLIFNQLLTLNQDFKKLNSDTIDIPAPFKVFEGNPNIEFCLAQRTPEGLPTNGIIRKHTDSTFAALSGQEKSDLTGGSTAWDIHRYLNIWICNEGYNGYAVFPSSNLMADYGITVNYNYLHYGGNVIDHELGHLFNLRHIWGDNYCADDSVTDTPVHYFSNLGCPTFPYIPFGSTCATSSDGEMFMNYMDYTSDECQNMFTQGQVERMRASIFLFCPQLISSNACLPVSLFPTDAGVSKIKNISDRSCNTFVNPLISFRNWGTNSLTSVKIYYQIDGNIPDSIIWTGILNSLDTASVYLPAVSVSSGSHVIKAYTSVPNNSSDDNPVNDTTEYEFRIYQTGNSLPYFEGFETSFFPPLLTSIPNIDGTYTWEKTTAIGCSGSFCMVMDNYAPGAMYPFMTCFGYLQKDEFILPNLDFTTIGSPSLTFRMAYAESNFWDPSILASDTLQVLISTDCGNTFTLLYQKTDSTLWTTASIMPAQPYTPANANDWRTETIDVSSYDTQNNVIIKLVDKNFIFGNRLFIDDLNIGSTTDIIKPKDDFTRIYPNPSDGRFNFEFEKDLDNYSIEIIDVLGKNISFSKEQTGHKKLTIVLLNQPEGVYFAKIRTKKNFYNCKLVNQKY